MRPRFANQPRSTMRVAIQPRSAGLDRDTSDEAGPDGDTCRLRHPGHLSSMQSVRRRPPALVWTELLGAREQDLTAMD
jgi:hypothetical protein